MKPLGLWERGLSLEKALFRFGDKKTIDRYEQLISSQPLWRVMSTLTEVINKKPNAFEKSSKASKDLSEQRDLRQKLEQNLLKQAAKGTLIGFGYSIPRSVNDQPTEIPKDIWQGSINWDQSTIRGSGLEFVSVRIVHSKWINEIASELVSKGAGRLPGRRSRRSQIQEAIKALDKAGKINTSESIRSHFPLIVDWIHERYPKDPDGDKGLGEKVLYEELSAFFNQDKSL